MPQALRNSSRATPPRRAHPQCPPAASCASCHGTVPTQTGKHASTGKPIGAMAPAFNPERFTDAAKTEKWFRRNCNDVLGRTCTATEKADVLAWLMTLKP